MDILVAFYNNKSYRDLLDKFKRCNSCYDIKCFVYNKSNEIICDTHKLENVGREGDTYLHHIIENYETLNDYTLFLQDDIDNHIMDTDAFVQSCFQNMRRNIPFQIFDVSWRKHSGPISRTIVNGILKNPLIADPEIISAFRYPHDIAQLNTLKNMPSETSIQELCDLVNVDVPSMYTTETSSFMLIHKSVILKHPKDLYIQLRKWLLLHERNGYILEHCWKLIFSVC